LFNVENCYFILFSNAAFTFNYDSAISFAKSFFTFSAYSD